MGAKTCMKCGYETTPAITEFELFLGTAIKPDSYARLNAISNRNSGLSCIQKSVLYKEKKKEMIATYKKGGDLAVIQNYPIHISTWNQLKKSPEWRLVKNEDRRIMTSHWAKPTGKQKILV